MIKSIPGMPIPAVKVTGNLGGTPMYKVPGVPVKITNGTSRPSVPKMPSGNK